MAETIAGNGPRVAFEDAEAEMPDSRMHGDEDRREEAVVERGTRQPAASARQRVTAGSLMTAP